MGDWEVHMQNQVRINFGKLSVLGTGKKKQAEKEKSEEEASFQRRIGARRLLPNLATIREGPPPDTHTFESIILCKKRDHVSAKHSKVRGENDALLNKDSMNDRDMHEHAWLMLVCRYRKNNGKKIAVCLYVQLSRYVFSLTLAPTIMKPIVFERGITPPHFVGSRFFRFRQLMYIYKQYILNGVNF